MGNVVKKNSFDELKFLAPVHHKSTFEFAKYGMSENLIKKVSEKEAVVFKNFKKVSDGYFELCQELYNISLELKPSGCWMEWYTHVGLSSDKVSELLKRQEIYTQFGAEKKDWVTSLSNEAVKILTGKVVSLEQMYDVAELELKKVEDIKTFLLSSNKDPVIIDTSPVDAPHEILTIEYSSEGFEKEFFQKFNKVEEVKKHIGNSNSFEELKKQKSLVSALRKQLADLEKAIEERTETLSLQNNRSLFDGE